MYKYKTKNSNFKQSLRFYNAFVFHTADGYCRQPAGQINPVNICTLHAIIEGHFPIEFFKYRRFS